MTNVSGLRLLKRCALVAVLTAPATFGTASQAAVLTYEYDPGPMVHNGFWNYDGACKDLVVDPSYEFSCDGTIDRTHPGIRDMIPVLSFDTALMPFDLQGKRLRISSLADRTNDDFEGMVVLDRNGSVVFEILADDYYDVFSLPWLTGFAYGIPGTIYDLWFDDDGLVTNWDVDFDNDQSGAHYTPSGSSAAVHLDDCGNCVYAFYGNDRPGEWLINGVPQSELAPAPVPLPGALGLLAAAVGVLPFLRARRVARH